MQPSAIVVLEALPLDPTGKIDRSALPMPGHEHLESRESHVDPCTPLEQYLAEVWREVLGVGQVSINDNFFALGEHSLLATQAVARINGLQQGSLTLHQFIQKPTIIDQAELLATS